MDGWRTLRNRYTMEISYSHAFTNASGRTGRVDKYLRQGSASADS